MFKSRQLLVRRQVPDRKSSEHPHFSNIEVKSTNILGQLWPTNELSKSGEKGTTAFAQVSELAIYFLLKCRMQSFAGEGDVQMIVAEV